MPSNVERVLIVHPFGIGDALFMTPVIRALNEQGAKKVDLFLGSRTQELFRHNPFVSEIFVMDHNQLKNKTFFERMAETGRLLKSLRKNHYDTLIDLSSLREYAFWAAFFVGIPRRVGFDYKNRGIFLTHRLPLERSFEKKHVIEYYIDLLRLLSVPTRQKTLQLFISEESIVEANRILKEAEVSEPFIAVAPGGGESWGRDARLKRWPVQFFSELIQKIESGSQGMKVVILGGKNEWELGESLRKLSPALFHNLAGKLSLLGSAAVLKRARLLIANDGGLVHMASAVGTPVAALFGPVDPAVYGPYPEDAKKVAIVNDGPECRPCYQNMRYQADCEHVNCLNTLFPDKVFKELDHRGFLKSLVRK